MIKTKMENSEFPDLVRLQIAVGYCLSSLLFQQCSNVLENKKYQRFVRSSAAIGLWFLLNLFTECNINSLKNIRICRF